MFKFMKINRTLKTVETLIQKQDLDGAEQLMQQLLGRYPNDAALMLHAAVIQFEKGASQAARDIIEKALKLAPDNPVLHLAMGEILHKEAKYQESMMSLHQSLVLSPDNPKAEYLLGLNCLALNRPDDATAHFEKVAREDQPFLLARLLTLGELIIAKKP